MNKPPTAVSRVIMNCFKCHAPLREGTTKCPYCGKSQKSWESVGDDTTPETSGDASPANTVIPSLETEFPELLPGERCRPH